MRFQDDRKVLEIRERRRVWQRRKRRTVCGILIRLGESGKCLEPKIYYVAWAVSCGDGAWCLMVMLEQWQDDDVQQVQSRKWRAAFRPVQV